MLNMLFHHWILLASIMICVWFFFIVSKNPSIVDFFWPIAIMASGGFSFLYINMNSATMMLFWLLFLWGIRLASYLFMSRVIKGHVDPRYTQMSQKWRMPEKLGYLLNYQFQGVLAGVIACPFWFAGDVQGFNLCLLLGGALTLIGLIGEAVADLQLQRFKIEPSGDVCNVGLWSISRHPNYFFEWLIWMGFGLSVQGQLNALIAWLSPITLLVIMLKITAPMTEAQSIRSRKTAYENYQKVVPMFFPRWPTSNRSSRY